MKKGLVLEGGAMRGMFSCGVCDVMLENGIQFDGAIGTSAGAVFGCNYKSNQAGRAIRYNTEYCRDKRYVSVENLVKTGNLYDKKFAYDTLVNSLDPFDTKTFKDSKMEFYVTCTDVYTGKAVYHKCENGDACDLEWMRASAAMPMFSEIVEVDGYKLLDGGIADSVPIQYFEQHGYDRNVIVLTQPLGYVKEPMSLYMPVIRRALRKYPKTVEALKNRHIEYNSTSKYIREEENSGKVFVIRPPESLHINSFTRNPEQLRRVYKIGRQTGEENLDRIKEYLSLA